MSRCASLCVVLALVACGADKSASRSTVDSSQFSSLAPAAPVDSTLRIIITSDAKVYADGHAITPNGLDSALAALKLINGEVWYYRAPRDPNFAEQQDSLVDSVLVAITRHELPFRLARKADFSDQEGKRRHTTGSDRP